MPWANVFAIIACGLAGGVATYIVLAPVEWAIRKLQKGS